MSELQHNIEVGLVAFTVLCCSAFHLGKVLLSGLEELRESWRRFTSKGDKEE
jgi:hypothetical protein